MKSAEQDMLKAATESRFATTGPGIVQIDLTGKCNNNCIGCWVHSPLIKNLPHDKNVTLSFEKAKELVDNLHSLGAKEIFLSGAGEPFLHPDIMDIIKLIKSKGFKLNIITNFTLVDEAKAKILVDSGVDMITASVWAAQPQTYVKTHPSKHKEDFFKIKENLKRIADIKAKTHKYLPHVKIYNVICNLNYREIDKMINLALYTQAESIEFQIMDIIDGETSSLALTPKQVKHIKEQFKSLTRRGDLYFKDLGLFSPESVREEELKEFPGRFMNVAKGFCLTEKIVEKEFPEDKEVVWRWITCPKGISTQPTSSNPFCDEENHILTFIFPPHDCRKCPMKECPVNKEGELRMKFLSILGFSSFIRRLNSSNIYEQLYEKDIIDTFPCYVGWNYSRVLSTGEVIPCCKAALKPLGNIYKDAFLKVWNSDAYLEFRNKAVSLPKSDPYFKEINCYKSCDNVGMNLQIEGKIIIPASGFKDGNLNNWAHSFGEGIVIDGGHGYGFAEYNIYFKKGGKYDLRSYYASAENRPVKLYFDGKLIANHALGSITKGWRKEDLRWFKELSIDISAGEHTLKLYTKGLVPHIRSFAFIRKIRQLSSEAIYQKPSSLRILKDKLSRLGPAGFTAKALNYIFSGTFMKNYLDILGIFNGRYAFKGPFHVQIDLTNNCNNDCIGCWCNSPLLEEKALPAHIKEQALPFGLVANLIDNLSEMGTKEIYFSGGGEPFAHPDIMRILAYARKRNLTCYVNTNFTLLDKEKIKMLIDLGVEHLTVSTWSATPKTYAATHPNKSEDTFRSIKENLMFLNNTKIDTPYIKLYNVIFNLNYHELKDMVCFAGDTGCESTEFTLIDTMPGKTDKLLLNPGQIKELQDSARQLASGLDKRGCLEGVLLFRFDSFLRRISSAMDLTKATYDRNVIDKIPCYIGWCFSRIMPNGDVNACLKAHRIPVGNLYKDAFSEIWNNEKQQYFRSKTMVYKKEDPFFRLIGNDPATQEAGCYKSCDDIGRNIYTHNLIMSLTPAERILLKTISRVKPNPRLHTKKIQKPPLLAGIINGRKAFIGPEQVVIDITNRCNERCIGCWLYSPLLKEAPADSWLKQEIDFVKAKSLIDDLADLGAKRIRLTGGGEPFMYPKIMELIEHIKSRGLICCLTTNFSLLDKERIKNLIRLQVDELAISLWASNKKMYMDTHPGAAPFMFDRIKENLLFVTSEKRGKPFVTLCNVICSVNYSEAEEMFRFALDTKSDGVYFTLVDIIHGSTGCLLLNEKQKRDVLIQTDKIKQHYYDLPQAMKIKLDYFDGFISRLKEAEPLSGNYDSDRVNKIPCYAGWIFSRILADGTVCPCCRGVKKPMGNINASRFKQIWHSQGYNEFRSRAKYMPKTDPYFCEIGCIKMCDNLMHNEQAHSQLKVAL